MTQSRLTRIAGLSFLSFPLLIQIPYTLLALRFDYPGILRRNPAEILERFAQGGPALTAIWYLYAILLLPLLAAIAYLPAVLKTPHPERLAAVTRIGVASAVVQMIGLLRWTFAVPLLAEAYVSAPDKSPILLVFQAQHQLLGVLLGEHLGQLLLAVWTLGVALTLRPKPLRILGTLAALLFFAGTLEHLSTVLPIRTAAFAPVAGIAFIVWSLWSILLGWHLLRGDKPAA